MRWDEIPRGGGGGALTLVLVACGSVTHCKTDLGSCGCQCGLGWKNRGCPKYSEKGAVRGANSVGAVVFGLSRPRKAS